MSSFAIHPIDPNEIAALLHGSHADPFRILGPHHAGDDLVIRVFRPEAKEIQVVAMDDQSRNLILATALNQGFGSDVMPFVAER